MVSLYSADRLRIQGGTQDWLRRGETPRHSDDLFHNDLLGPCVNARKQKIFPGPKSISASQVVRGSIRYLEVGVAFVGAFVLLVPFGSKLGFRVNWIVRGSCPPAAQWSKVFTNIFLPAHGKEGTAGRDRGTFVNLQHQTSFFQLRF